MANKKLFDTTQIKIPVADAVNREGSPAYKLENKHALAQLASTGCFRDTFYVSAKEQLDMICDCATTLDSEFIAKCAVYARQKGYMKDSPALLMAILALRSHEEHGTENEGKSAALFRKAFPLVIDNGRMLRNLVQILRSGKAGNIDAPPKNLSANTIVKKCIQDFLNEVPSAVLFRWSVGNDPSLADVIRMVRPKPIDEEKAAFFQYLLSNTKVENGEYKTLFKKEVLYSHKFSQLPEIVQEYERFKQDQSGPVPRVEFRLLDSLGLSKDQWADVAKNASWTEVKKNLNTYQRHGVFDIQANVDAVANKLRDEKLISKAKAFPYELLVAYREVDGVPYEINSALQDAMEVATKNVPKFEGKVYALVDISASMSHSITGTGYNIKASKVRCVDVAALIGATILRNNPTAEVLPFNTCVRDINLNPRDSIMTNANLLASQCNGGTQVGNAIESINDRNGKGDLIFVISDNESWFDGWRAQQRGPKGQEEWNNFKRRNPGSKIICLDIAPDMSTQIKQKAGVLNIGGFSDQVFGIAASFLKSSSIDHWVSEIESVDFLQKRD